MIMDLAAAREVIAAQLAELAAHGLRPAHQPDLRLGEGMLCYFDRSDGHIYLALPDPAAPLGKLRGLLFRSMTACASDEELQEFVALLLPQLIAHELGHCFRHQLGRFGPDLWHEEQVATQLANALTKRRLAPADRQQLAFFLRRALTHLQAQSGHGAAALRTYHDPWVALTAGGALGPDVAGLLALLHQLSVFSPDALRRDVDTTFGEAITQWNDRQAYIEAFNRDYTAQVGRYLVFQFTWMLLDLESPDQVYLGEVLPAHYLEPERVLPATPRPVGTPTVLAAYFQAAQVLPDNMAGVKRYLYKRYREMLLDAMAERLSGGAPAVGEDLLRMLGLWREPEADLLRFAGVLLPDTLVPSLPHRIAATSPLSADAMADALEPITDRSLWLDAQAPRDSAASALRERLMVIDATGSLRPLPSALVLAVAQAMIPLRLTAGDVLIWAGSDNTDLFLISQGALAVSAGGRQVAILGPGDVVGEAAFLARQPRTATVRAVQDATCFVLKASALRRLTFQYPDLLWALGGETARRLAHVLATMTDPGPGHA